MSGIIYHYTNAQGLLGILDKKNDDITLWFTHYKYLNDSSEGVELQRIYQIVIHEMYEKEELSEEDYQSIKSMQFEDKHIYAYTILDDNEPLTHVKSREDDAYICCFSKNGDSLNMWRYYSKKDTGYAVGLFDYSMRSATKIESFSPNETRIGKFTWNDVIYDDEEKHKTIYKEIKTEMQKLRESGLPNKENLYTAIHGSLLKHKFFFKHNCFHEEEEVRCVLTIPQNNDTFTAKTPYDVLYRTRNGIITPYVKVPFKKKSLHSVTVAPTAPEEAKETIEKYLKSYGSNAPVQKSQLPIRF